MKHFVVRWCAENNQFSVIRECNVVDGTIRANPEAALGKKIKVSWKNDEYEAVLLSFGSKKEMDKYCNEMADAVSDEDVGQPLQGSLSLGNQKLKTPVVGTTKKKNRRRLENVLSQIAAVVEIPSSDDQVVHFTDWQSLYTLEKEKNDTLTMKFGRLKERYRERKAELKKLKADTDEKSRVTLAEGVSVERGALSTAKLMSTGPAKLARNLFRIVFKKDELLGKSLLGKMCNANKNSPRLPSVDNVRRDAVISYCLSAYGHSSDPVNGNEALMQYRIMKKEVIASLSKYIREVNNSKTEVPAADDMLLENDAV